MNAADNIHVEIGVPNCHRCAIPPLDIICDDCQDLVAARVIDAAKHLVLSGAAYEPRLGYRNDLGLSARASLVMAVYNLIMAIPEDELTETERAFKMRIRTSCALLTTKEEK